MRDKIISKIIENINLEQENSPFLFVWENLELINEKVKSYSLELLKTLEIPSVNLFTLSDWWENIKISEIKSFLEKSNSKTPYKIQIFLIENFSRITLQSANSCLKIFEEPWIQNIFFLTNKSESGVLDTILSRVQVVNLESRIPKIKNDFYYNLLIESINNKNSKNLISYFFKNKLEKTEYIIFLNTIIIFIKDNFIFINYLEEINDDINMIEKNNVLAKNIVDKWILNII
jgi:hypothetical protein